MVNIKLFDLANNISFSFGVALWPNYYSWYSNERCSHVVHINGLPVWLQISVLFRHTVYILTRTSLPALQCCTMPGLHRPTVLLKAAAQLVPQRADEHKHTSRGYSEMWNRTSTKKQSKIISSC